MGCFNNPLAYDASHSGDAWSLITEVTTEEVAKILSSMPSKTSPLDILPTTILKSCSDIFSVVISTMANLSFSEGRFPTDFKSAQLKPLLKKPGLDDDVLANYRPISNLTTISKVIEKLFLHRLNDHISKSRNLNMRQSAFRCHHSTETALQAILNDVYRSVGRKQLTLLVGLDISAAFDTLDHATLLKRLEHTFGISGAALAWVSSYLAGRTQFVKIGEKSSTTHSCCYGVPQGSVLGPVLFTLYTSPVAGIIEGAGLRHHQYADDTQLYVSFGRDSKDRAVESIEELTAIVRDWFQSNGLMLNPDKSEAVLIGTRQRLSTVDLPSISIAGTTIDLSDNLKSLGVTIDGDLTFDRHVRNLCKTSYFNIRALRQIRSSLTRDTANTVASAIVSTRLDYCNSLLGGITNENISRLQRVQNSLARIVSGSRRIDHITPILRDLHWLPIKSRIEYKIGCLTFRAKVTQQPSYLAALLVPHQPARALRSSELNRLSVPFVSSKIETRAFSVAGPTVFNSLPETVKNSTSMIEFRKLLKTFLFGQAYGI